MSDSPAPRAPRVSVILPCLNEERYVAATLDSILSGTYPADDMEVLVIDGGSRDRSRAIVEEIARRDPRVRLLDNPRRITPCALNIGVRAARGAILLRVDAHSVFPPHYVETLVRTLESTGADMVGGCIENVPWDDRLMAHAIAYATGSAVGTGSRFRYQKEPGPVDAAPFGCWRREVFDKVGLFDERLVRNQDNEHSSRILHHGGRIFMTSDVVIRYHARSSLRKLCETAILTGTWNAFTERLHPYTFRWRHFLPGVFFAGVLFIAALIAAGVALDYRIALAGTAFFAPYALANLYASIRIGRARRRLLLIPVVAAVLFSYHFTYGFGVARGWLLVATGRWRRRLETPPTEGRTL